MALLLFPLFALALAAPPAASRIDSLVALPALPTVDEDAGLRLAPHALELDPIGRIWALDRARGRILPIEAPGPGRSLPIQASRGATPPSFSDIAASGSYLYLLDSGRTRIVLADLDGNSRDSVDLSAAIEEGGLGAGIASLLLVDRSGAVTLIEPGAGRVIQVDRRGRFAGAPLESLARPQRPGRIADARLGGGDEVVLLDPDGPSLFTLTPDGIVEGPVRIEAEIQGPVSLAIDPQGRRFVIGSAGEVLVVDRRGERIWEGRITLGDGLGPHRALITRDWILCVANPSKGAIDRWQIARAPSTRQER